MSFDQYCITLYLRLSRFVIIGRLPYTGSFVDVDDSQVACDGNIDSRSAQLGRCGIQAEYPDLHAAGSVDCDAAADLVIIDKQEVMVRVILISIVLDEGGRRSR